MTNLTMPLMEWFDGWLAIILLGGIAVAAKTLQGFQDKCSRLYKQERCAPVQLETS